MTAGSLFSGIGGFDLGLERAGFRVLWQVEIDPKCRSVLRRHWPDTAIYEDVRHVGRANLAPVDLICGGFPCVDVSVAGRRAGLAGERSGLWFEFRRIVEELRPCWVLVENVPGLRSSAGGRDLAVILRGLAELGYMGAWRSLDSRYLGLAQRRERVFLLAVRDTRAGSPVEILSLAEGLPGHSQEGREAWEGAAGDVEAGAGGEGGGVAGPLDVGAGGGFPRTDGACSGHVVARALTSERGQRNNGTEQNFVLSRPLDTNAGDYSRSDSQAIVAHTLRAAGHDASEDGTGRETPIVVSDTLRVGGRAQGAGSSYDNTPIVVAECFDDPRRFDADGIHGGGEHGDMHPTLRPTNPAAIVLGFNATQDPISTPDGMHALSDQGAAVLAFAPLQGGRSMPVTPECPTLEAGTGNKAPAVLVQAIIEGAHGVTLIDQAGSLQGGGGKPGQGYQAVLAFDTTQITSPTNRCRPEPGDPCHPLAAGAHPPAIAYALRSDAGRDGVAKTPSADAEGRLRLRDPGFNAYEEIAPTLDATHPHTVVLAVPRRLTPVECSRLQGFPDSWNQWGVTEDGERVELSDSTRYAQLGNAVSVPVAAWIGHRLARAVVAALRGEGCMPPSARDALGEQLDGAARAGGGR